MVSVSIPQSSASTGNGMRPVNLRTDLAPLADLIELVFEDTMDSSGRAALREMRMLSRVGAGLNLLSRLNEMAIGINMGYVWIEDGKLIGNVSIYPANWHPDLGSAWIIANVGVHPDYQRRGIARRLMQASLEMIQTRQGRTAILQVDYDNHIAQNLYSSLGFIQERAWTHWRRPAAARTVLPLVDTPVHMTHRRRGEWRTEYELAQRVRPATLGGIGWLRPLHRKLFNPGIFGWLDNLLNLRSTERLVIRSGDEREILASLWIDTGFTTSARMTLMVDPRYAGVYDDALINTAVRRYGGTAMIIEHPHDETRTGEVLEHYRFSRQRSIIHMRLDML